MIKPEVQGFDKSNPYKIEKRKVSIYNEIFDWFIEKIHGYSFQITLI